MGGDAQGKPGGGAPIKVERRDRPELSADHHELVQGDPIHRNRDQQAMPGGVDRDGAATRPLAIVAMDAIGPTWFDQERPGLQHAGPGAGLDVPKPREAQLSAFDDHRATATTLRLDLPPLIDEKATRAQIGLEVATVDGPDEARRKRAGNSKTGRGPLQRQPVPRRVETQGPGLEPKSSCQARDLESSRR